MKNKQKCRLLPVLVFLFCHNSGSHGFSFQSQPSGNYNNDYTSKYQTSNGGYDSSRGFGNSGPGKSQLISSSFGNGKPSFATSNDQTGYNRGSSVVEEDDYDGNWNRGSGFSQSRPGFALVEPKKVTGNQWSSNSNSNWGSGSESASNPGKNANSGSGSNQGWNSGFQNVEFKTEGYGFSSPKKNSDKQQNGNFNRPLSSGPGPKKNQGRPSSGNFGWTPAQKNEEPITEGYGSFSPSRESQGNQWNTNSGGFSFGSSSEKKQGTGKDAWAFSDGDSNPEPSSSSNKKKTGKPGLGPNHWTSRPEKTDPKQPQKGYSPQGGNKPAANKPSSGKKTDSVDWDTLEKETRGGGALDIDVSQLWYTNDRRKPYGSGTARQTKKRNIGADAGECYCTEFADCDSESVVDVMGVFRSGYFHLREKVAECAIRNKICCRTGQTPIGNVAERGNELGMYRNQGINQRPSCGKRVSELGENDRSTEGLANYGDFPWILRMIASSDDGVETLCSAALIHNSVALTTASCALLLTGGEIRARAGEWYAVEGNNRNNVQETKIGKIFLHPKFDFVEYTNDLALIFLDEPLDSGLGVNSVCLPSPKDVWDSSRCVTAGWIREDGQGVKQPMLAEIDLSAVTEGKCRNNSEQVHYNMETNDSGYLCGRSRNVNPCIADSGALLMCPLINSNMQVLIGFLSQKAICNEFYKTAAYANILESMPWISHMEGMYLYFNNVGLVN